MEQLGQVRLIRIRDAPNDDDLLEIDLTTWYLNDAPRYNAISYTWGNNDSRVLLINDRPCRVRKNCYNALWQVRLHRSYAVEYVWIDSICINQDDLDEKAAQIPLMAAIYTQSHHTLSCLGPHVHNSQMVVDAVSQMREANARAAQADGVTSDMILAFERYVFGRRWHRWVDGLSQDYLHELRQALRAFASHPYWTRLWIVQEVALSRGSAMVFCGHDILCSGDIELILQLVGGGENDEDLPLAPPKAFWGEISIETLAKEFQAMETLWRADPRWYLDSVLALTSRYHCQDARDHIYGILCLIVWKPGQDPIVPDYTKSCFELALEAIAHVRDMGLVAVLLDVLGVRHNQTEMKDLFSRPLVETDGEDRRNYLKNKQIDIKIGYNQTVRCATILTDDQESFLQVADSAIRCSVVGEVDRNLASKPFIDTLERYRDLSTLKPQLLFNQNAMPVALVSGSAQMDDILVPISSRFTNFLILRSNGLEFDITGQGFFLPGYVIPDWDVCCNTDRERRSVFDAEFTLDLNVGDVMRLVGQDFVDLETYDPEARLQRLVTNPISRPGGAAELLNDVDYD